MEKLAVCWPCDEQMSYFKSLTDIESDVNWMINFNFISVKQLINFFCESKANLSDSR